MKNIFRIVSFLEGVSYILLLGVATLIKYTTGNESYVQMLGMPHGLLFVAYVVLAYLIKDAMQWDRKTFLIVLVASLIPFGTFYIDKKYLRN